VVVWLCLRKRAGDNAEVSLSEPEISDQSCRQVHRTAVDLNSVLHGH
jgi:hypothetical protein